MAAKLFFERGDINKYQEAQELLKKLRAMEELQKGSVSGKSTNIAAPQSSSKEDNCFIATATFGTSDAKEVVKYRRFRDEFLVKNLLGRIFVHIYYLCSPPLAHFISSKPKLKKIMSVFLSNLSKYLPTQKSNN